jgi:ABC-type nickel/cobalt efflux system permease component RcnA
MKEALKEEIGVWKENLKAVIYLFVIDISGTVARAVKVGIVDSWVITGVLTAYLLLGIYILVWMRLTKLINKLKEMGK